MVQLWCHFFYYKTENISIFLATFTPFLHRFFRQSFLSSPLLKKKMGYNKPTYQLLLQIVFWWLICCSPFSFSAMERIEIDKKYVKKEENVAEK